MSWALISERDPRSSTGLGPVIAQERTQFDLVVGGPYETLCEARAALLVLVGACEDLDAARARVADLVARGLVPAAAAPVSRLDVG